MKKSKIKPVKNKKIDLHEAINQIFDYLGENPSREGLLDTPDRMIRSWEALLGGYKANPDDIFKVFDSEGYNEMILLRNIEFNSMCEHHFLGFSGIAHVGYVPHKKIVGISKIARLVEIFSHRLQVQERLTMQIADTLMKNLSPKGVGVILEGTHSCMGCRGVKSRSVIMVTSALRGIYMQQKVRQEFLKLAINK